ncbi:hypothetical protein CEXT_315111 [Caerostris extrusa]|uniref:Uncharacterized protein n=1 Tax=Caerostris extrusa TaxID=172846 RepID=A0AAV4NCS1_CAEEX|nr:hypothetical protein CEXT_315111 [Caerostris extrusa]
MQFPTDCVPPEGTFKSFAPLRVSTDPYFLSIKMKRSTYRCVLRSPSGFVLIAIRISYDLHPAKRADNLQFPNSGFPSPIESVECDIRKNQPDLNIYTLSKDPPPSTCGNESQFSSPIESGECDIRKNPPDLNVYALSKDPPPFTCGNESA